MPASARAESGTVSLIGSGKDSGEAIAALLRVAVSKHLKSVEPALAQSVLKNEIMPNSSSFVQSYRMLDSGGGTYVNLSASVDLDVLRSLYALTPKALEEPGAKTLIIVKGQKVPAVAAVKGKEPGAEPNPYIALESTARDRFTRRGFEPVSLPPEEASVGAGDDVSSPELLRGLGAKAGARLAFGVTSRFETVENENSHSQEDRVQLNAVLVDVKSGVVLGRESSSILSPKSKKEQFAGDLQRALAEESRDILQALLVQAGRKLSGTEGKSSFAVLRVLYPSNPALVSRFRTALEGVKELKSVAEYRIRRGAFDFAVTPALDAKSMAKIIKGLPAEDLVIAFAESDASGGDTAPLITVKLAPKSAAEPQGGAVEEP